MVAAFIWGTAFIAQSKGLEQIGNFTFLAGRSYLAVIVLLPVSYMIYKSKKRTVKGKHDNEPFITKRLLWAGFLCGGALFFASFTQQYGIVLSGVGKSGFLTTLYILIVPLIGIVFKRRVQPVLWLCIGIALVGMYFLCVTDVGGMSRGDLLLVLCAFLFAVQITVVDKYIDSLDGVRLSMVQFAVVSVLSTVFAIALEDISLSAVIGAAFPIFYAGVLSSGIAYTLQIVAQKNLNATVASLLMSLESVFAAISGAVFGERLTTNEIVGCCLVFLAIIVAQLPVEEFFKAKNIAKKSARE